jgi:hypothetical protein
MKTEEKRDSGPEKAGLDLSFVMRHRHEVGLG